MTDSPARRLGRMPNFLIIGASKGGTTSLHYVLDQHPQVYMCPVKEAGFFWAYGQNVKLRGPGTEKLHNRLVDDLERYQKLFAPVTTQTALGEASVRYLYMPQAPGLIRQFIPQARLIAILRQPAERAFSAFMHNRRDGLEPCSDFAEAIAQDRSGFRDAWTFCRYLDRGLYAQSLRRYFEVFERRQLHISLFEDLRDDPQRLAQGLFEFLEVDVSFPADFSERHNASGVIRNPALRFVWTRTNRLRAALRPMLGERLRHRGAQWFTRDLEKVRLDPTLRADLTAYYREDILQLQDLLDRDLASWLVP